MDFVEEIEFKPKERLALIITNSFYEGREDV